MLWGALSVRDTELCSPDSRGLDFHSPASTSPLPTMAGMGEEYKILGTFACRQGGSIAGGTLSKEEHQVHPWGSKSTSEPGEVRDTRW